MKRNIAMSVLSALALVVGLASGATPAAAADESRQAVASATVNEVSDSPQHAIDRERAASEAREAWAARPPSFTVLNAASPAPSVVTLAVESTGSISGQVTSAATGLPVTGVTVCAFRVSTNSGTCPAVAPDGTYSFTGLAPDSYRIQFNGQFAAPFDPSLRTEYYNNARSYATATLVAVAAGETVTDIDASLEAAGGLSGTVTLADGGAAASGVSVCATETTSFETGCTTTGADGTYSLGGLGAGSYRVNFNPSSPYLADEYYSNTTSYSAATPVTVMVGSTVGGIDAALEKGGAIAGTVTVAATGLPPAAGGSVCAFESATASVVCTSIGPDGAYLLAGAPAGSYRVNFYANDKYLASEYYDNTTSYSGATLVPVTIDNTTGGIDAQLESGGEITGTVTAQVGGVPVQGILVCAIGIVSNTGSCAPTAADGTFALGRLAVGDYRVQFDGNASYAGEIFNNVTSFADSTPITVSAGATSSGVDAALAPGGSITGTVTSQTTGLPLSGVSVCAFVTGTSISRCSSTGSDGTYSAVGLPEGSYRVSFFKYASFYAQEYFANARTSADATLVAVTAGATSTGINAALEDAGAISGTVTAQESGLPVSGVLVCPTLTGASEAACATTNADGTYAVYGLLPNSYRVFFQSRSADLADEFYDDARTEEAATPVAVSAGVVVTEIDAALEAASAVGPVIASVAPATGPVAGGTTVTITGTGFEAATEVTFGGTSAASFTVNPAGTSIEAVTPAHAAGTVDVSVTTPLGGDTLAAAFTYQAPATAPGVVNDMEFTGLTKSILASWTPPSSDGGSPITSYEARAYTAETGGTFVKACSASAPATTCTITGLTNGTTYWVTVRARNAVSWGPMLPREAAVPAVPAPTVTSITPTSGTVNGGTKVTIAGTFFTGATSVTVGGRPATSLRVVSATQITAVTPIGSAGAADVSVTTPGGTATLASGFTYVVTAPGQPRSLSLRPLTGGAVASWAAPVSDGGSPITSYEARVYDAATGGSLVTLCTAVAPSRTCTVSGLTNGTTYWVAARARNSIGWGPFTARATVTPDVQVPSITSLSPTNASAGGGTTVTILGTNFTGATGVSFGATAAASFTVNSDTSITAVTAAGAPGTVDVTVTVPGASGTKPAAFTYVVKAPGAPQALVLTPGNLQATASWTAPISDGGSAITSYEARAYDAESGGTLMGVCSVTAPGTTCTLTGLTNGATYWVAARARNSIGWGPFTARGSVTPMVPVPSIASITPATGSASGGTSVTITGTTFTGVTSVVFGGTPATSFTVNSNTSITAVTPPGVAGSVDVVVGNGLATGTLTGGFTYTVRAPGAPQSVVTTPGDGTAIVEWSAPASDGGSPITSYEARVYDAESGGSLVRLCSSTAPITTCTVTGLTNGTTYWVAVRARNIVGWGSFTGRLPVTPAA